MDKNQEIMQFTCEKCGELKEGSATIGGGQELCWDCASKVFYEAQSPPTEAWLTDGEIAAIVREWFPILGTGGPVEALCDAAWAKAATYYEARISGMEADGSAICLKWAGEVERLSNHMADLVAAVDRFLGEPTSPVKWQDLEDALSEVKDAD